MHYLEEGSFKSHSHVGSKKASLRTNRDELLREVSYFFDDPDDPERGMLVVLCAEPYMDSAGILGALMRKAKATDVPSAYVDFMGANVVEPIIELGRTSRRMIGLAEDRGAVVCLNGLPACDDVDVPRVVRPLTAMACHNCLVVMAVAPEAMYLIDAIKGSRIYRSRDLMSLSWPSSTKRNRRLYTMTHGIPSLVSCCRRIEQSGSEPTIEDMEYVASLSYCVRTFLRESLMNEERKMRCAAVLLGSGTYAELAALAGSKSLELLDQSSVDSPFFGINAEAQRFECVGISRVDGLNAVYRVVADACAGYMQLPIAVSEMLVQRGEVVRAALVSLMSPKEDERKQLVINNATEFFNAGELTLLQDAVTDPPLAAYNDPKAVENARALFLSVSEEWQVADSPTMSDEMDEALLPGYLACRFRAILSGVRLDEGLTIHSQGDARLKNVSTFIEAARLAIVGDLRDSYSKLLDCVSTMDMSEKSVFSGSVAIVYAVVATLVGASLNIAEQTWLYSARSFFEDFGLDVGKASCDAAIELIALVAGSDVDTERIEGLARKAERYNLIVIHAFCRMAGIIKDLRAGAAVRSYVRVKSLIEESEEAGLPLLAVQANILLVAFAVSMGDKPSKDDLSTTSMEVPELLPLFRVVYQIAFDDSGRMLDNDNDDGPHCSLPKTEKALPAHSLWLIDVLSKDCGDFSRSFQDYLPRAWRRAIGQLSSIHIPQSDPGEVKDTSGVKKQRQAPSVEGPEGLRIEIFLLGRFSIKINGRELDPRYLERRRARFMLAFLALVPGHSLRRYAIIESVWPELDYESGIHRVYEATSVLRHKLVGANGAKIPVPLLSNRMEHSMMLNPECVWVDIDHFVGLVQRILDSEGNDRLVVGLCRQAEGFYRGDMVVPPNDGLGIASKRREQLRGLFADAMVAGSTAASRLGLRLTAARFARKAYAANNEREDALICLLKALVATGRGLEAEKEYREFAVRIVEKGHRPPSRELRKLVAELLESRNKSTTEKGRKKNPDAGHEPGSSANTQM